MYGNLSFLLFYFVNLSTTVNTVYTNKYSNLSVNNRSFNICRQVRDRKGRQFFFKCRIILIK